MALSKPRFRRAKITLAIDGFYVTLPLQNGYRLRRDVELWEPGDTYRQDVDEKTPTLDRRQLIRAGAWAAPVIVLATAAPAAAAGSSDGNVPATALTVQAYGLFNSNANGTRGPLGWAGGQVGYWNPVSTVAIATFTWTAILLRPDGTSSTVAGGAGSAPAGQAFAIPAMNVAEKPLAVGTYKITVTVYGSGGTSTSAQNSVTVV